MPGEKNNPEVEFVFLGEKVGDGVLEQVDNLILDILVEWWLKKESEKQNSGDKKKNKRKGDQDDHRICEEVN